VKTPIVAYEPAFGGIVSVLAGAFLCFVLFASWGRKGSLTGTVFLSIICVRVTAWGVSQIVGYRKAKRNPDHFPEQAPLLGTAVSCVLVGLLSVPVTLMLYEFATNHPSYAFVSGSFAVLLLSVGVVVGIRQGVWR
jgi:high-affinity Fe2+/Pb2+ permease